MNWKTTVFGTLASVGAALSSTMAGSKYQGLVASAAALFGALFAFFAKDKNVTGGTTVQPK